MSALLLLVVARPLWSQSAVWQPPGATTGTIYYNGGNVGIGATAPPARLQVCANNCSSGDTLLIGNDLYLNDIDYANTIALKGSLNPGEAGLRFGNGGAEVYGKSGNIGIGTRDPRARLEVVGDPTSTSPQLRIRPQGGVPSTTSVPSYLDFFSTFDKYSADQGPRRTATIKAHFSNGIWGNEVLAFEVGGSNDSASEPLERMRILGNGNVGIGTTTPQYKLAVEGSIGARDIIVTNAPWSDYVFRPDYRLRPLSEVDHFIRQHGHLPEIPSEAEVKEKGVSVAEVQAKLLAKIEELTLHMIQQEKDNRELRDRLVRLEKGGASGTLPAAVR